MHLSRSLVVLILSVLIPVTVAIEPDQQSETDLAQQLAVTLQKIIADPGAHWTQREAVQRKQHNAALIDLQRLSEFVTKLVTAFEQGQTIEQTRPLYRKIKSLRQSIRDYAQGSAVSEDVRAMADQASTLFDKLNSIYQTP